MVSSVTLGCPDAGMPVASYADITGGEVTERSIGGVRDVRAQVRQCS
jgi:hypothetical protein